MGAFQTKEANGSPMSYQNSTPPRELGITKRQLPFDPRSPTDNIARTPIIVESVPNELQALDPRSPTYGIERTPVTALFGELAEDQKTEMEVDSNSQALPPFDSAQSAPICQAEDTGDISMTTPQKHFTPSDLESVENLIPDIDSEDASPLLENAEEQPLTVEPTPMQTKVVSHPKKLFPMTQPAPPAAVKQAPVSRSLGLVVRDANSPRSIVQTKQRRQIDKSVGGVRSQVGIDKENMAH